jgi:hypothetical protein
MVMVILLVVMACNSKLPQVEATVSNPQIVDLTKIVSPSLNPTMIDEETSVSVLENATISTEIAPSGIDPAYYDGIILITQYFTLLDHGLFEDAYKLLSKKSRQHSPNVDDYVNMAKTTYKSVLIKTIQPYYTWANQQGLQALPETNDDRRFYVQIVTNGGEDLSVSSLSDDLQTLFLTLILEDNQWKIDAFSTAPWWP